MILRGCNIAFSEDSGRKDYSSTLSLANKQVCDAVIVSCQTNGTDSEELQILNGILTAQLQKVRLSILIKIRHIPCM